MYVVFLISYELQEIKTLKEKITFRRICSKYIVHSKSIRTQRDIFF